MKKLTLWLIFTLLSLSLSIIFYNQYTLMHPEKKPLESYHYEWLTEPQKHSIHIQKHLTTSAIPYLIVTHDGNVPLSKRATILKKQLSARGYTPDTLHNNGILVMFHGKNGRKEDLLPVAERYSVAGFTCILVDLPSHGENHNQLQAYGQHPIEMHYKKTVLSDAMQYINLKDQPIYLWGMSLGGAFAISNTSLQEENYKTQALILVSTFDRLSNVLSKKSKGVFGETLGAILYEGLAYALETFYNFTPEKVNSTSHAKKITLPVLIFHGDKDELIHHQNGKNLFHAFASNKKRFILDKEGNHKNILITNYPFYAESVDFLLSLKETSAKDQTQQLIQR